MLWELTFWLHTSNKLKKLQSKYEWQNCQERFDGRHGDGRVYPGTWQHGQVGQGRQFGHEVSPSVLLTAWRFYSPNFAQISYSVLITRSSLSFFPFFLGCTLVRFRQAGVWHPFGSIPSFLFSEVASVLVKPCCLRELIQETEGRAAEFGGSVCKKIGDWSENT